jgi:two-component system LytT family sensor kinase
MKKSILRFIITMASAALLSIIGLLIRMWLVPHVVAGHQIGITISSFFYAILIWEGNRLINLYLNKIIPFEKNVTLRIIVQLLVASMYMVIVRFSAIYFFWERIPEFVRRQEVVLRIIYFLDIILAAAIHLAYISRYFFKQWKLSLQKAERLEKEKTQVQFDNLKNQLNPHFLFNNLTLLDGLIHEQPELASKFLQHLAKIYRYVLQHQDKETVSLETENEFINHYVSLMETRFGEGLKITRSFTPEALEKRIVPVTLQILIENAIKHNTVHPKNPLIIQLYEEEGYLLAKNNIQLKKQVESSNQVGLSNLKSLYLYLSKKNIEIYNQNQYFTVKIPLIEE